MKNVKSVKKNNKGFSLVELIVVIAIMAVLVGVLAPTFIKYVESSRQSTDIQNIQQLKTTVEVECANNQNITAASIEVTGGASGTAVIKTTPADSITTTAVSTNLKSSSWQTVTFTYNVSTGKWTNSDSAKLNNTVEPGKSLGDIFN
jgi:type IV pilus assembly protein PilA